jgi:hypothetical protein
MRSKSVRIRNPCITNSESMPIVAFGPDIEDPEGMAKDTAAMERFVKDTSNRHDLEFVRWDYLTCHQ